MKKTYKELEDSSDDYDDDEEIVVQKKFIKTKTNKPNKKFPYLNILKNKKSLFQKITSSLFQVEYPDPDNQREFIKLSDNTYSGEWKGTYVKVPKKLSKVMIYNKMPIKKKKCGVGFKTNKRLTGKLYTKKRNPNKFSINNDIELEDSKDFKDLKDFKDFKDLKDHKDDISSKRQYKTNANPVTEERIDKYNLLMGDLVNQMNVLMASKYSLQTVQVKTTIRLFLIVMIAVGVLYIISSIIGLFTYTGLPVLVMRSIWIWLIVYSLIAVEDILFYITVVIFSNDTLSLVVSIFNIMLQIIAIWIASVGLSWLSIGLTNGFVIIISGIVLFLGYRYRSYLIEERMLSPSVDMTAIRQALLALFIISSNWFNILLVKQIITLVLLFIFYISSIFQLLDEMAEALKGVMNKYNSAEISGMLFVATKIISTQYIILLFFFHILDMMLKDLWVKDLFGKA